LFSFPGALPHPSVVEKIRADICVIGAGSGGLSVAAGAAQMGARVVLVEKGRMGGDCLNYGCVPSKSLLAAARAAQHVRDATGFGVTAGEPGVDFAAVNRHVRDVIAQIEPHDSQERFEGLGVTVVRETAEFAGPRLVRAGNKEISAKRVVVATGSSPAVAPIKGLDGVPYLTNETIFDLTDAPAHLAIIGGGPIGCEMAQAHRRLGCPVTLLERDAILSRDDPDLSSILRERLTCEGVDLRERIKIESVHGTEGDIRIVTDQGQINASHILVATGRRPNIDDLNLEAAGIDHDRTGIMVDRRLRTSNKKVYAIGDVTGGYQFTHQAGYHAGIVIQNILFRLPAKADDTSLPWVTYTEPELAQVGLTAYELEQRYPEGRVLSVPYSASDRAKAERVGEGLLKVMVDQAGRIRGVSIVGQSAGELIQPWLLAMTQGLKIRAMTGFRAPYPTLGELNKFAASSYFTPKLFSDTTRKIVRLLMKLP
jgi:pyruvate/2-oxoglutarate dehydrogenase complex dihydrolipoamide dehydrogenase (E3) component